MIKALRRDLGCDVDDRLVARVVIERSPPSTFGAAGAKIKAQLIAALQAAAAAHARELDDEPAWNRQAEIDDAKEDGEDDAVDDEISPDGMSRQQRREGRGGGGGADRGAA